MGPGARSAWPGRQDENVAPPYESLPYRACAGLAVFNREGRVFIGRRLDGPEHTDATHCWQMPQGGIDPGEDTYRAALRELYEETSIRSVQKLGEIPEWLTYDIPREIAGRAWRGNTAGRRRNGMRCVSPARKAKSISWSPAAARIGRNLPAGAGSGWKRRPNWWCRSRRRSMGGWCGLLRNMHKPNRPHPEERRTRPPILRDAPCRRSSV